MVDVMISTKTLTRKEWLDFRKNGIRGSAIAVICNISKYKSPLQLWMEETNSSINLLKEMMN